MRAESARCESENVSLHGCLAMGSMESEPCMGMNMIVCLGMIMNLGRELHGEYDIALVKSLHYQSRG